MSKKNTNVPRETVEQRQMKNVGRALRIARLDQNIKLQDLSVQSGVTYLTISKLEKGSLENPNLQTINKIAKALGLSVTITIDKQ